MMRKTAARHQTGHRSFVTHAFIHKFFSFPIGVRESEARRLFEMTRRRREPWQFCNVVILGASCSSGVCQPFLFSFFRFFPLVLRPDVEPSDRLVTIGTFPALLLPLQKAPRFCGTPSGTDRHPGAYFNDVMLADCAVPYMSIRAT